MDNNQVKIVNTDNAGEHGENRCPKCGASDVTYNTKKGKLICNYCYTEFETVQADGFEKDVKNLTGETRGSGTKDIDQNASDIITLKCGGCGAEVVINTQEATNARCHWCRSILSINSQIDNGAIPDVVLPFGLSKQDAQTKIKKFVDDRQFFANPTFKKEFTINNIMGVYFPYLLVDANAHARFRGQGEHQVRSYTVEHGDKKETVYDADLYDIQREFDIAIDDLTIESNSDRLNKNSSDRTNNVINAVMPFDTENCVQYQANYLAGFSSEKRNINISNIEEKVNAQMKDITRHSINQKLSFYDRGIRWDEEMLDIKGKQWISAYLPVWLYSYQDPGKVLHYVAVNARTGETMGSVPLDKKKLLLISLLIEIVCIIVAIIGGSSDSSYAKLFYILFAVGFVFYGWKVSKYRNASARHNYESETKNEITNLQAGDNLIQHRTELSNSRMSSANNQRIEGEKVSIQQ